MISEVEVLDEDRAARYRELAAASIAKYGGRYLARGAAPEVLEGEFPAARRVVVVEFPDQATADRWYRSPEYAEALEIGRTVLDRRLLLVPGLA